MAEVVIDASALVDVLLAERLGRAVGERLDGEAWHAPAHVDAEVLSAIGRLHRAGLLASATVSTMIGELGDLPLERHPLPPLLSGAWGRRDRLRLVDALYVELADSAGMRLVTTDRRLAPEPVADVVEVVAHP